MYGLGGDVTQSTESWLRRIGAAVGAGSLLMVGLSAFLLLARDDTSVGLTMLAFFGATGIAGLGVLIATLRPKGAKAAEREQLVLKLAEASGGRITIAQIASQTSLSVAEAKESLEELARQGVAEVLFDDDGAIVYELKGLGKQDAGGTRHASARNPLREMEEKLRE